MTERLDPYAVLGVTPTATQAQIRRAYRALMRLHHPDTRGASASRGAPDSLDRDEVLRQAAAAYAVLGDPRARAEHDRTRRGPRSPGGQPIEVHRTEAPRRADEEAPPAIRVGPVRWYPTSR